ncbi:MAG: hypothetical protein RXQ97_06285, partial [Caldivirga sp.]
AITAFNSPLRSSGCSGLFGFLSFVVYFEWWSLEQGSGAHSMTHPCSNGFDEGIEWLFQLKENEGIEKVFQWFKVQCKMGKLHETCKAMIVWVNLEPMVCIGEDARNMHFKQLKCMITCLAALNHLHAANPRHKPQVSLPK